MRANGHLLLNSEKVIRRSIRSFSIPPPQTFELFKILARSHTPPRGGGGTKLCPTLVPDFDDEMPLPKKQM